MTAGLITGFNPVAELGSQINVNTSTDQSSNFSDALKNSAEKQNVKEPVKQEKETASKEKVTEETNKTSEVKEKKLVKEEKTSKDESIDEATVEAVSEAVGAAMQAIAEVAEVPVEVVSDVIESLGMTDVDVLDTANIPEITVNLAEGDKTTIDLVTDEELYADVKEITEQIGEIVDEVAQKLDIEPKKVPEMAKEITANTPEVTEEAGATQNVEIKVEQTGKSQQRETDGNHQGGEQLGTQQMFDNIQELVAGKVSDKAFEGAQVDVENIMEQVQESVKLNMNHETTEMEINLHPASLGNVRIQVAAKDGVVTANITTENEQVKAVLESQVVELKEHMNEQGIKVEAVEVMVGTHAFDENLSKEGESSESQQQTTKKRRSININDLTEDDDIIIDDAEAIARDMMIKNGNTVDYMA